MAVVTSILEQLNFVDYHEPATLHDAEDSLFWVALFEMVDVWKILAR